MNNLHDVLDSIKHRISCEVLSRFPVSVIRERSKENLERWRSQGTWVTSYDEWRDILESPDDRDLISIMVGINQKSNRLRHSMPYVGMLDQNLVMQIHADFDDPTHQANQRSVHFRNSLTLDELPHFEIRALAMIGAGLLKRHLGDPKAVEKLLGLAVTIDGYRQNLTVKTLVSLCEEAAGSPLDDDEAIFLEIEKILSQRERGKS